jgi:peptidoglycan-associated lipoprotein
MLRSSALIFVVAVGLFACAKKPAKEPVSETSPTSARARAGVNVSDDLVKACNIQFGNVNRAPKFDYDEAALLPEDRDVLAQVARCVTTGPLKGRELALVGRADPRGETEYNMVLGEHRAEAVHAYLAHLGVDAAKMEKTSRGELDAEGTDEDTFKLDRRVDISLR